MKNTILKTPQEKYQARYHEVEGLIPAQLAPWGKISALEALQMGLVRSRSLPLEESDWEYPRDLRPDTSFAEKLTFEKIGLAFLNCIP